MRRSRLLLVCPLTLEGALAPGPESVAIDPGLDAGPGDAVLLAKEGAVVADLFDHGLPPGMPRMPANLVVVAVVDPQCLPRLA